MSIFFLKKENPSRVKKVLEINTSQNSFFFFFFFSIEKLVSMRRVIGLVVVDSTYFNF